MAGLRWLSTGKTKRYADFLGFRVGEAVVPIKHGVGTVPRSGRSTRQKQNALRRKSTDKFTDRFLRVRRPQPGVQATREHIIHRCSATTEPSDGVERRGFVEAIDLVKNSVTGRGKQ
jgi:hypothetical protein